MFFFSHMHLQNNPPLNGFSASYVTSSRFGARKSIWLQQQHGISAKAVMQQIFCSVTVFYINFSFVLFWILFKIKHFHFVALFDIKTDVMSVSVDPHLCMRNVKFVGKLCMLRFSVTCSFFLSYQSPLEAATWDHRVAVGNTRKHKDLIPNISSKYVEQTFPPSWHT